MSKEESKSDVVKPVSSDDQIARAKELIVGCSNWHDIQSRILPRLVGIIEEADRLKTLNQTQQESILEFQSQLRVMKEAIKAAIEFADLSQRCPHNCGPSCCAEGRSHMLRAEALAVQLRSAVTPKGD